MYDPVASEPPAHSSQIAAELHRLAPHYEFSTARNVIFTRGLISAVVDHVVVDRWGVLVIDAETHAGATILGTDTDTKWTATFAGGQVAEFRNPLHLNAGNENLVKQALTDAGVSLEPNEIRSAVVFAGADISRLSLVEVSAAKVKTAETIGEIFEARRAFPPSSGRLSGADIDRIMTIVAQRAQALPVEEEVVGPWQADPAVVASNEMALLVSPPPTRVDNIARAPIELAGHHTGPAEGPSLRSALLTLGTIVVIILTLVAGLVFYPQLQAGSTAAWTATLVLFVALAELVAANIAAAPRNAGRTRPGETAGGVVRFLLRLMLVFVIVAAGWVFIAGGLAESLGDSLAERIGPDDPNAATAVTPSPGVIAAKRRLREKAPQVYKTVTNLNSPSVYSGTEGKTSYTWTYTPKDSSVPTSFTLTIDTNGEIVSP